MPNFVVEARKVRQSISDIKDAVTLHLYSLAVKFAMQVEKASVRADDKEVLMMAFIGGQLDKQVGQASPVNQWPPLVKARAAEQAAEVAKAAAMARQAAFEEHQRAIQEKEALANADAAVEVLASQERAVFVAAARLWHSELVGPCCLELEKAKAALMAGKQAREAQVCATSAKAMSYEAGLRNGQLPRDFMATQSASYFFYGFDMFLWIFWVASPSSTTSIFL